MSSRIKKVLSPRMKRLRLESLEQRQLLDAAGVLWGAGSRFSVSFVSDGTAVGSEANELFDSFQHLGDTSEWQEAILRGFQTWAKHTSIDIASVEDDGSALGAFGFTADDSRFGDIRIAAIPLEVDEAITSISPNQVDGGTWTGDVIFNSKFQVESIDQLFALTLHEAGHLFGLEHTDDDQSVMNPNASLKSTLSEADLAKLDAIHGDRKPDAFEPKPRESTDGEDPFDPAVDPDVDPNTDPNVEPNVEPSVDPEADPEAQGPKPDDDPSTVDPNSDATGTDPDDGMDESGAGDENAEPLVDSALAFDSGDPTTPVVLFADLQSADDVDAYHVSEIADPDDSLTVRLVTEEVSQLRATLTLKTTDGFVLGRAGFSDFGRDQSLFVPSLGGLDPNSLVVEVTSTEQDAPYDAGGYTLVLTQGEIEDIQDREILEGCLGIATTRSRTHSPDVIQTYLSSCRENSIQSILAGLSLGFVDPVLGPEPVDSTEASFCEHDWLNHLFSCFVVGDIDGDGQVDFADFLQLSSNFGKKDAIRADGDLTGDKAVDFADFLIVSRRFGQPPKYETLDSDLDVEDSEDDLFPAFPPLR